MKANAVYVHIPFCAAKCFYCDFNSYPGQQGLFDDYVRAISLEISRTSNNEDISTVYFGGGTPTVLSSQQLSNILNAIYDGFTIEPDAEITTEANPGTVDGRKFRDLRQAGFNRLSMGIQSLDNDMLKRLGRVHSVEEALDAYADARAAGFENIGLDLMFALPGQTLTDWRYTLGQAVKLYPEHISLYELSIEEGTRFAALYGSEGKIADRALLADEDAKLAMYEATIETLVSAGYEHYEVSNFARPGYRSRHNQVYWRNEPYFGFGAGATSYINGVRETRTALPKDYINTVISGDRPIQSSEVVSKDTSMGETIMLALRTAEGLDLKRFEERYGKDATEVYREPIARFSASGLLETTNGYLRLTRSGFYLADEIAQEFLP